jgi:hypothetical protein
MKTKISVAAAMVSAALGFGALAMPANAQVDVDLYLGIPHYDYRVGPDYVYRPGHGWYLPRDFRGRLSCGEARRIVRRSGFRNVSTVECRGRTYTFLATRYGRDIRVYVNSRTGGVWRG